MNTCDTLDVMAALFELLEHPDIDLTVTTRNAVRTETKRLAAKLLEFGAVTDLDTIQKCATILDRHAPEVGPAKVRWAARNLDEHRAAIVAACLAHNGPRLRLDTTDDVEQAVGLSIYEDHRPGWGQPSRPAGLDAPSPWEINRARRLADLDRQLRSHPRQLPARVRAALADIRTKPTANTFTDDQRHRLAANHEEAAVYRAHRERGASHTRAYRLATTPAKKVRTTRAAEQLADDYARTRLGTPDRSALPNTRVTRFDIDDEEATQTQRAMSYRCSLCAYMREETDIINPRHDDRLCGDCRNLSAQFVRPQFTTTPCVWCHIDRAHADHRGTFHGHGHADGHDDGLCSDCRENNRPGLPPLFADVRRLMRKKAHTHTDDRETLTEQATVYARCASIARYYDARPTTALTWLRAYYEIAPETHRPIIARWGKHLTQNRPTPPTPLTGAATPQRQLAAVA